MKRWVFLIVVTLSGGLGGYWFVDTVMRKSTSQAAVELFEMYCVPFWTGTLVVPGQGFQRVDTLSWYDERSRLGVGFTPFSCAISDMFSIIGKRNHSDLRRAVEGGVSTHMPEFDASSPEIMLDETKQVLWARGEGDDRMAVSLFWDETGKMVLFAARAQTPQYLEQLQSNAGFQGYWGLSGSKN